jgi:23S rRNA pseudoU1915 N3-methylase RlmH
MYKVIIISDSNKHFDNAIGEYTKRLWKNCDIIKIKPIKNGTEKQIIEKETSFLIEKLDKLKGFKIVLNPIWKSLNTKKLFNMIEEKKHNFPDIIFIVGWANWLDYGSLKGKVDFSLNLWEMTMPHSLALLVIMEQIYRLEMIKKWTSYDK